MSEARRARPWLAVALTGLAGTAVAAALAPTAACTTHECDGTTTAFPDPDSGEQGVLTVVGDVATGELLEWESSPEQGGYLEYPGNRTIDVTFPPAVLAAVKAGADCTILTYVSTAESQDGAGVATMASGQLAQFPSLTTTGFQLQNGTCADYKARFVVQCALGGADAGPRVSSDAASATPDADAHAEAAAEAASPPLDGASDAVHN